MKGPDDPLMVLTTKGVRAEVRRDGSVHVHGDDGHEEKALDIASALWGLWTTAVAAVREEREDQASRAFRVVMT